jgi:hypothetical protein
MKLLVVIIGFSFGYFVIGELFLGRVVFPIIRRLWNGPTCGGQW